MANSESQLPKEEKMDTKEEKMEEGQDMETAKENTSKQEAKTWSRLHGVAYHFD